jgi:hypothetical protein
MAPGGGCHLRKSITGMFKLNALFGLNRNGIGQSFRSFLKAGILRKEGAILIQSLRAGKRAAL